MKKRLIITSILAALTLGVTSCSLDKRPYGVIEPENALETIQDAERLRNGLYDFFRTCVGGTFATADEIRSDLFHATAGFGNNGGSMYYWNYTPADGTPETIWANCYILIANANLFIERASSVNTEDWTDADRQNLSIWMGEAYFIRAYFHNELVKYFCLDYKGNEDSYGVPYITSYSPSSDQSTYPTRGTLRETYEKINADLQQARELVTTAGSVGSTRITADVVTALIARVALNMGDYATAETEAGALIDSGRYPLISATDTAAFRNMWTNDSGTECIFQFDASYPNELGSSYDYGYISYQYTQDQYTPWYVPTQEVIDLYDPNDLRFRYHFGARTITASGGATYDLLLLTKFPGNPLLRQSISDNNYQQKAKPFRIAEMYLIRAEARANISGDWASDINALRQARIPDYNVANTTNDAPTNILQERVRELIGEGFRMQDLRRFNQGLLRGDAQVPEAIYMPDTYQGFEVPAGNFRMIFPIPQEEIDANRQIAGQQNPGY